jgi:hypothetical protein
MTLIFTPSSLTKFGQSGAYSFSADIPLTGDLATVSASLLTWLNKQLVSGEAVSQIVLESGGSVTMDDETTTTTRSTLIAAVSVTAPLGQRTFSVNSETLPADLRDGLLGAWDYLSNLP